MPPHRYRIFTHEGNEASRKPFGAASEAELNSQPEKVVQQQQQQPKVKKLIHKHSWGFKPRAASSPNLTYGQGQRQGTNISPVPVQGAKIMNRPNTSHKPSMIIPSQLQLSSDRSVQFRGIPASVGLSSIVAQSSGGPLERIETKPENGSGPNKPYTVELHFLHPANSTSFFNYASTGRFIVNGQSYLPYRNHSHYNIKSRSVLEEMLYRGARRCITLKMINSSEYVKPVGRKNGYNVSLNLTLEWIKKHFEKFGQIVSIQPMITTTITICIQYSDVRSAIRAKSLFDKREEGWAKLYHKWTLKYGKDPVDKTCPATLAR